MPTITVPIIAQSTATPPVFYGMIATLTLVLDSGNNFVSGQVNFTKPQPLVAKNPYTVSQVGNTPVIQNGNLQFQLTAGVSVYPGGPPASKPPFTFTGQIDVAAQKITGQFAWLPPGLLTVLAQSTLATGNFTQPKSTFTNPPPPIPTILSLAQWQNPSYNSGLLATGLQGMTSCTLELDVPTPVPQDATFYLNLEGGTTTTPINISVWYGRNPPTVLASLAQPSSSGFVWYSCVIPPNTIQSPTNYIQISNNAQAGAGTIAYIKNVAVVW
jgi:hypothetical protein